MRLTMLTVAASLLYLVAGCTRHVGPPLVTHSIPAHGLRTVDIAVPNQSGALDLQWQYGQMVTPEKYATLDPGSSARIVIVEDLNGTCGAYISHAGSTTKLPLTIPDPQYDGPRSVLVKQASPSLDQIYAAPQEIVRVEWINSSAPEDTDKRAMFIAFGLKQTQ